MPFSSTATCSESEWTTIFNTIFKPAVENAGLNYECRRSEATRGNLVAAIIQDLRDANVVIADLTDQNPNVFYELGVRHSLKKGTILLAQKREYIPFDLQSYANHVYEWKTPEGKAEFNQKLKELLSEIESNPDRSDSPVSDFGNLRSIGLLPWIIRPGGPQFRLSPGIDNNNGTLLCTFQVDGSPHPGGIEARWIGAGTKHDWTVPMNETIPAGATYKKFQMKAVKMAPNPPEDSVAFEIKFYLEDGFHGARWIWPMHQHEKGFWRLDQHLGSGVFQPRRNDIS